MKYLARAAGVLRFTNKRSGVVAKNIVASFVIQGVALILALFTLPAYLRYFDDQKILGVWFTILSVLSWILNLDLGLGNGLRNRLVAALSENGLVSARKYISSAYVMIFSIVAMLALAVGVGFRFVDWNWVFGVPRESISPAVLAETVIITTVGVLFQFGLRLIVSILYALQKSAVTGLLNVATTVGMLFVVTNMDSGTNAEKVVLLAKASVVAVNAPLVIASLFVFGTSLRACIPRIRYFDRACAWDVAKFGGVFFLLQVTFMLIANTDPFLISQFAGPQHVVDYQIYSRFFFLGSTLFTLALTPVWSAVTQASTEGDYQWIALLYSRMRRMAVIAIVGLIAFCWLLPWIIHVWLGKQGIAIELRYSLVFAGLAGVLIWTGVMSSVVNGTGRLRVQLMTLSAGVLLKIPIAIFLTHLVGSWIGVIAASVIALLPYSILQPIWIDRYLAESREAVSAHGVGYADVGV
jgi:O-antigen/teichoic acid export membrane protein